MARPLTPAISHNHRRGVFPCRLEMQNILLDGRQLALLTAQPGQ